MRKIIPIIIAVSLLAVSVPGLTINYEAVEREINSNEEILTITNTCEDTNDVIFFDGKEYYLPAFPAKTQEQLDKMIIDPQPTMAADDLPSYFSWKSFGGDWTTRAQDQGNCGSCWAFGAIGGLEAAINIAKGDPDFDRDLSEQYILSCLSAAGSCGGGWMSEAIEYIKSTASGSSGNGINGVPLESCMPYTADDWLPCSDKCDDWDYYTSPPAEDNVLFQVKDFGVTSINPSSSSDWDLLKTWVYTYGPIVVDIYASSGWSSFWNSHHDSADVYEGTESGSWTNHAQLLCGWVDDDSVHNGGYWILKNSWGTGFGYGGFSNVAYGCLMLGDRDVTWVTSTDWPNVEPPNPEDDFHPLKFVHAGWNYDPGCPRTGTEIEFQDQSRGPVVLWNWDFDGDGQWDISGNSLDAKTPEWTYTSEGNYKVTQEVWSADGLSSTLAKFVQIKEIWPPVAVSEPSYYGGEDNVVHFEGRFSYDVDGQITAYAWDFNNDGNIDSTDSHYTYTFPNENGEYNAKLTVTDNEGATNTLTIPVKIDKTVPPETNIIAGGIDQDDELWFKDDVLVGLQTTDWSGVARLYYSIDNGDWKEKYCGGELEFLVEFYIRDNGLHTIQYYAIDKYGNTESTKTSKVGIDDDIPSVYVILDGEKNAENVYISSVKVTINAEDDNAGIDVIKYKIDNDDYKDYTSPLTLNQGGFHTVSIIVEDKAGNSVGDSFNVMLNYGPDIPKISGPNKGSPNVEYTFSFTSSDTDHEQVAYYVEWGDGTNSGWSDYVDSGKTVQFKHTWAEEKVYTIKAKAKDDQGAESDWATFSVSLPKAKNSMFDRLLDNFPFLQKLLSLPFFQKILEI